MYAINLVVCRQAKERDMGKAIHFELANGGQPNLRDWFGMNQNFKKVKD